MKGNNPFMRPTDMVAEIARHLRVPRDSVTIEVDTHHGPTLFVALVYLGHEDRMLGEPASTPTQALDNLVQQLRSARCG